MGFPRPDKRSHVSHSSRSVFALWLRFDIIFLKKKKTLHHHQQLKTHMNPGTRDPVVFLPQPIFFTHLFYLNSSLFSVRVYFYPVVGGRSQRNDEAWETRSSPWQPYSKPSLSNASPFSSCGTSTFVTLITLSPSSGAIFLQHSSLRVL